MAETASTEIIATETVMEGPADASHYVDWHAIFAGAVLAVAVALVLITFGSAIGLTLTSPFKGEGVSAVGFAIAVGVWFVWVQVSSFMAGGYLAGRMRRRLWTGTEHEVEVRDGTHGLVVWAVGMILGALIAASTAAGVVKTAAETAGDVVSATTQAAGRVGGSAMAAGFGNDLERHIDAMFRPLPGGSAAESQTRREEAQRLLLHGLDGDGINDEDKAYLAQVIARHTGLDEQAARIRVDRTVGEARAAADAAVEAARQAADVARKSAIIAAFVTAATMLIAAAGAWWAAGVGGRHRDEGTVIRQLAMWR